MLQQLKDHICSRLGNDLDNLEYVLSHFKERKLKRNEWLLKEGEVCRHVHFLSSGALQVFVNEDGNENTRDIVLEDNWCSDLISFGSQQPATEQIRTIEAAEICSIDRPSFQKLLEAVPQFDKVYRQILEQSYANSVYRINSFVALNSLDRIKWLLKNRPNLMTRVSSKLIASYLGINKDVFSRLKAQL
ncbi:MAG: Crp/Fnr family transcriptional regulator [Flavihumibacter sp.]|jgi:CRP-like cAMP-binding protein|nr:Crp/Fnr family transcriptional regulator [Flavihumibacter sp.]